MNWSPIVGNILILGNVLLYFLIVLTGVASLNSLKEDSLWFKLIMANFILMIILKLIIRKNVRVVFFLCFKHLLLRWSFTVVKIVVYFFGYMVILVAFVMPYFEFSLLFSGIFLLFIGFISSRVADCVHADKITRTEVWMKGFGKDYLDHLEA